MNTPLVITVLFAIALLAALGLKLWLAGRQMAHVARHRGQVPTPFAERVPLAAHQRAADYTVAKGRLGLLSTAWASAVLLGWTLLGGLDALNTVVREVVQPAWGDLAYQLVLVGAFSVIGGLLELPFELFHIFRIEQRFGFNRVTLRLWLADQLKGLLVGLLIGAPILALILWIMGTTGGLWWFWAWLTWTGFQLLAMVLYPTLIAPLFNTFTPLADEALRERVQALMQRCGFAAQGLYVMDGSRRSAHGNAYFTGLGAAKRVVFFDTLLNKLAPGEVEAVLAHELGHYRHGHIRKRLLLMCGLSLAALALLGWLAQLPAFYVGLGVRPNMGAPNDALALLLFLQVVPLTGVFLQPAMAALSRRDEFEADAYACAQADGRDLARALLKLHEDNASTLTPDPLYARFYYSHPPAAERLAALPRPAGA
ncbi:M48 family metallopeptidase [Pseudaquabacterium rugosum]|uniref:M48 family metallopeptidase n=1 Tax=Pseudaquabacterium rugosum TaxID=2984194 RepID=A0ABU9B7C2_9BURK